MSASWSTAPEGAATLRGVSLSAEAGQLVVLIGAVGAGKSSVLLALLGELPHITSAEDGRAGVALGGLGFAAGTRTALSVQEPWIISGSLRDNVTLHAPFDADRYHDLP